MSMMNTITETQERDGLAHSIDGLVSGLCSRPDAPCLTFERLVYKAFAGNVEDNRIAAERLLDADPRVMRKGHGWMMAKDGRGLSDTATARVFEIEDTWCHVEMVSFTSSTSIRISMRPKFRQRGFGSEMLAWHEQSVTVINEHVSKLDAVQVEATFFMALSAIRGE